MDYNDVTLIESSTGYEGFFKVTGYKLRHLKFDGEQTRPLYRECFERGHAVGVLAYDPWKDAWIQGSYEDGKVVLPEFRRSIVVRIEH